jgi:hypothetical protein
MEHPIVTLFKPLLAMDKKDAANYFGEHLVLTSPHYTTLLEKWAATLAIPERRKAERAIRFKTAIFEGIRTDPDYMALMPTTIQELATRTVSGRITLGSAKEIAGSTEVFVELMYPAVMSVCETAEKVMIQNWRPAVTLMEILFAALDARGKIIPENQQAMEMTAIESWLAVVRVACNDVPDGRIFRDAVARAEPVADLDMGSDPPAPILHRLGTLHLDAYFGGRPTSKIELEAQLAAWQNRLYQEYGNTLVRAPEDTLKMPPISEAPKKAAFYFRRAAARRTGEARGRTLKALAQALVWHDVLGLPFDLKEFSSAAREALVLLPRQDFPAEHLELNRLISMMEHDG